MPWRPPRPVRIAVATAVTVVVVAPVALLFVFLAVTIGIGWTAILVATAVLFVWIAEKWWVVLDLANPLLWLKLVPGVWSWAA